MFKNNSRFIYWLPALVWMALIFLLSSRPALQASSIDWQDFMLKKTAHFIEYFILNTLMLLAMKKTFSFSTSRLIITSLLLTIIYAASDELHQTFISGREGRLRDVCIDSFGASVSALLFRQEKLFNIA